MARKSLLNITYSCEGFLDGSACVCIRVYVGTYMCLPTSVCKWVRTWFPFTRWVLYVVVAIRNLCCLRGDKIIRFVEFGSWPEVTAFQRDLISKIGNQKTQGSFKQDRLESSFALNGRELCTYKWLYSVSRVHKRR